MLSNQTALSMPHPLISRRTAVQAGAIGLLGLGQHHQRALQAADHIDRPTPATAKSCVYVFLSGGLAQQDSLDLKPEAPDGIRGEFSPIDTQTPGIQICEHLPLLAQRSNDWALVRSLTHPTNDHTLGHYFMLTGRSTKSVGFLGDRKPRPSDWPAIASTVGDAVRSRNNLPPSIVLPERLVHWSGGVIPGNYGGLMGQQRDPFFIEASPYGDPMWRGAYPEYTFPNQSKTPPQQPDARVYQAPQLTLNPGLTRGRLDARMSLLQDLDSQRRALEESAAVRKYDQHSESVISLLSDAKVRDAFDVTNADDETARRYGKNSFGWSMLMAFRLVHAGVNFVQVNLGNNETWDTHGDAFFRFKNRLFPPTDRALCAFLDDLKATGLLESTLVVMGSEFGRTPKLSTLSDSFHAAGRDHWGAVQTVFFAGGGVRGGNVVGSSDKIGSYPASSPQTPENMAATIYSALGIPRTAAWYDELNRPHQIYYGEPIDGLI